MSAIKDAVGADMYEQMRGVIKSSFPDAATVVTDDAVDAAFQVAKYDLNAPALQALDIPQPVAPTCGGGPQFEYYEAWATHSRTAAPHSQFIGKLPLVRFRIPDQGTAQTLPIIHTPAGDLLPNDRLYPSVDVLWSTYGSDPLLRLGRPERVDMVTPPRLSGARFSAIAVYLCYAKETDPGPSFYILEAGLATGEARMPYLGRSMDAVIIAQTQYNPTAFSQPWHFYRGTLAMDANDPGEPSVLSIDVFEREPPTDQYLNVRVEYRKVSAPVLIDPYQITIIAGARLQAIADALGAPSGLTGREWFLRLIDDVALKALFTVPPQKGPS